MNNHFNIIIAGAGGIAQAVGLLLAQWGKVTPTIFIGNRTLQNAQKVAKWIEIGTTKPCVINPFRLTDEEITEEMKIIFNESDILLDCLPGHMAPKMARYAKDFNLHYANLTEYVAETNEIKKLGKDVQKGFVLQTGLAPGYINVLAHKLYKDFCHEFKVEKVDSLVFKVGALTNHAIAPHYYGFTWSPIGVATEYMKDTLVLRDYKKSNLPPLSERAIIIINGIRYEEDLTSGGAADLPDALTHKVCSLDYKTLRHPGHYSWVEKQLRELKNKENPITELQEIMETAIPHIKDDQIVLYAAVQGKDSNGVLRRREIDKKIKPQIVGKHTLRAIQTTTAVPLIQSASWLLETSPRGVTLQSQIDPKSFLNGNFIVPVYGKVK